MKGMSILYNVPPVYPYPNEYGAPQFNNGLRAYDHQNFQQALGALLAGISDEAAAVDFYSRLADCAPNQNHKNIILHAFEDKKAHLKEFTDLYGALTGKRPHCQFRKIHFNSYKDGLQKAYEVEQKDYQQYENSYWLTRTLPVGQVFLRALTDEKQHAARFHQLLKEARGELGDYGRQPFVIDIEKAAVQNNTFRTAIWTGKNLQVTVMSIDVGDDIGLEVHESGDQFIRVEKGKALVQMGDTRDNLNFQARVQDGYAIMIPEGKWHNVTNIGDEKLKVYVIYAPPEHPFGTVHQTKADAMAAEENRFWKIRKD